MTEEKKTPNDGKREPQDLPDTALDEVSGGRLPNRTLNPQPLPPITL